jgi:tetratricopeptide (TPR) repeat protein
VIEDPCVPAGRHPPGPLPHAATLFGGGKTPFRIKTVSTNPTSTERQIEQLRQQAQQLLRQGRYPDALAASLEACNLSLRHLAADHPGLGLSLRSLAEVCERQGNYTEAEPLLQEAHEAIGRSRGEDDALYAATLAMLAGVHRDRGNLPAALPLYQRALETFGRLSAETDPCYVLTLNGLARVYAGQHRHREAEELLRRAVRSSSAGRRKPTPCMPSSWIAWRPWMCSKTLRRPRKPASKRWRSAAAPLARTIPILRGP